MSAALMLVGVIAGLAAGIAALASGFGIWLALAVYSATGASVILLSALAIVLHCRLSRWRAERRAPAVPEAEPARR